MKEQEIRPKEIFDKYLELAEKDMKTYFSGCEYNKRKCPACGEDGKKEFIKKGFEYALCGKCGTLYVNPLPEPEAFRRYYSEAPSTKFWATDFYKHTEESRRELIFAPKAQRVKEQNAKYGKEGVALVDIGGAYGTFAEEFKKISGGPVSVIEPNPSFTPILKKKKLTVVQKFFEDTDTGDFPKGQKCLTSFEMVEHLGDPARFFKHVAKVMHDDDLFIFTTLNGMGLDILVLWEQSNSIYPPHHVNFFNTVSVATALRNTGLEPIEISTPGKLDVNILSNNMGKIKDNFWRAFIEKSDEKTKQEMQDFITRNNWSSHMMIVARKA